MIRSHISTNSCKRGLKRESTIYLTRKKKHSPQNSIYVCTLFSSTTFLQRKLVSILFSYNKYIKLPRVLSPDFLYHRSKHIWTKCIFNFFHFFSGPTIETCLRLAGKEPDRLPSPSTVANINTQRLCLVKKNQYKKNCQKKKPLLCTTTNMSSNMGDSLFLIKKVIICFRTSWNGYKIST